MSVEVLEPPRQSEMPFAIVQGEPMTVLPEGLYIPPDAMRVLLEAFEGPLDLLLYLIRRQNIDILNIPIANITEQYMEYVDLMKDHNFELAAEYLVMAAVLAEIKSQTLLPRPVTAEGEEVDPRAELVRRLQEYERYKKAAEDIDALPRLNRDIFLVSTQLPDLQRERPVPVVNLRELLLSLSDVLKRVDLSAHHMIRRETLSVQERMVEVLSALKERQFLVFSHLLKPEEGRLGLVVTLIAVLELIKNSLVDIVQAEPFSQIHIKAVTS